jgi:hypothetical protein
MAKDIPLNKVLPLYSTARLSTVIIIMQLGGKSRNYTLCIYEMQRFSNFEKLTMIWL